MPALYAITRHELIREIASELGVLVVRDGTATAGASSTLTDTTLLIHGSPDQLAGYQVRIYGGTGSGQYRRISGSDTTNDRITVVPGWSTTPDSTSTYDIIKVLDFQDVENAINAAIRVAAQALLIPKVDETLIFGDLLQGDGQMERWSNGTGSNNLPDNWTRSVGTWLRDTTDFTRGSAGIQSTSATDTATYLQYSVANFARWAGASLTLRADIKTTLASRVDTYISDGIATSDLTDITSTGAFQYAQDLTLTVDDNPSQLVIRLRTSAGAATVADWDNVKLLHGDMLEHDLPSVEDSNTGRHFVYIYAVEYDDDDDVSNWLTLDSTYWNIINAPTPQIQFTSDAPIALGARIRLRGYRHPLEMTSDTGTTEVRPEFLKVYAKWLLTQNEKVRNAIGTTETEHDRMRFDIANLLRDMRVSLQPGSRPVNTV